MGDEYQSILDEIQELESDTREDHGHYCVTVFKKDNKKDIHMGICTCGMHEHIVPRMPSKPVKGCYVAAIQIPTSIH